MQREWSGVHALADLVVRELELRAHRTPKATHIMQICERLFFASLKTEELQHATISLTYIDPQNPDPNPPSIIHRDQWGFVPFAKSAAFDTRTLVKLSHACDPRSSSFAVYPKTRGELKIWGIIDQQVQRHEWLNLESDSGPRPPGVFQAVAVGPGHIKVYIGYENIAELRLDKLVSDKPDVFRRGAIFDRLSAGISAHVEAVRNAHSNEIEVYLPRLINDWVGVLSRLLLRIQAYQHGGAILLTPDADFEHLNVKHAIDYQRLRTALLAINLHGREAYDAADKIWSKHAFERKKMPTDLWLKEVEEREEYEMARSELTGAIWFTSLLTRVDGLVLMDPYLNVHGFGVEILASANPDRFQTASRAVPSARSMRPVDLNRFGTRHRSMIRYCNAVPGAVGFVVSQDGPVRAVTKVSDAVVMWEDVSINHEYAKRGSRRSSRRRVL